MTNFAIKTIHPSTPINTVFVSIYQFGIGEQKFSACFVLDCSNNISEESARRADCHLFWRSQETKERIFLATPYLFNHKGYYPQHNQLLQTLGIVTVGDLVLSVETDSERFINHFSDRDNFFKFLFQNYVYGNVHRYLFCEFGEQGCQNDKLLSTQILNNIEYLKMNELQNSLSLVSQFTYDAQDLVPIAVIETGVVTHTDCSHRLLKNSKKVAKQDNFLVDLLYRSLADSIQHTHHHEFYPTFMSLVEKENKIAQIPQRTNALASPKIPPSIQFLLKHWLNPHNQPLACYTQTSQYPAITQQTKRLADPFYGLENAEAIHDNHGILCAFGVFDKLLSHKFMKFAQKEFLLSPCVFLVERLEQFSEGTRLLLIVKNLTFEDKVKLKRELMAMKDAFEQVCCFSLSLTVYEYQQNSLFIWVVIGVVGQSIPDNKPPQSEKEEQDILQPKIKTLADFKQGLTPISLIGSNQQIAQGFYDHFEVLFYSLYKSDVIPVLILNLPDLEPTKEAPAENQEPVSQTANNETQNQNEPQTTASIVQNSKAEVKPQPTEENQDTDNTEATETGEVINRHDAGEKLETGNTDTPPKICSTINDNKAKLGPVSKDKKSAKSKSNGDDDAQAKGENGKDGQSSQSKPTFQKEDKKAVQNKQQVAQEAQQQEQQEKTSEQVEAIDDTDDDTEFEEIDICLQNGDNDDKTTNLSVADIHPPDLGVNSF